MIRLNVLPGLVSAAALLAPLAGETATVTYAVMGDKFAVTGNNLLSTPGNYYAGVAPVSSLTETDLRLWLYGQEAVNDLGEDFLMRRVQLTSGYGGAGVISGDPLNIGAEGIEMKTDLATPQVQRFNCRINAMAKAMSVAAYGEDCLYFTGLLSTTSNDTARLQYKFTGSGTKVIAGGFRLETRTGEGVSQYQQSFSGGTTIVASDVYVPSILLNNGATIVITNGATFTVWDTNGTNGHTFLHDGTLDVVDGTFLNRGNFCTAQAVKTSPTVINVRHKGVLDTGGPGLRLSNNYKTDVNVGPGGRLYYREAGQSAFCENGETHFHVCGGKVITGDTLNGASRFRIGYGKTREPTFSFGGNELTVTDGGELSFTGFEDLSSTMGNAVSFPIVFDDGRLTFNASTTVFAFGSTATAGHLSVRLREGGLTIDTFGGDVVWDAVPLDGTDVPDGTDGGLVKTGKGCLTLSAAARYKGATVVRNGTLHVSDATCLTGAVDLRPQAVLSFDGAKLTLAALTAKAGVVKLAAGQSLELAVAPSVDGSLVFDVPVADGTVTLLTAPGLSPDLAAACAAKTPVAGKSCTFAVEGDALTLTVADGTAPDAPTFPACEDVRTFVAKGETVTLDAAPVAPIVLEGANSSGNCRIDYRGTDDLTLTGDQLVMRGGTTISLAKTAGDVTLVGPIDTRFAPTTAEKLYLSGAGSRIDAAGYRLSGDWTGGFPYADWNALVFSGGKYLFDSTFADGFLAGLTIYPGSSFTVQDNALTLPPCVDSTGKLDVTNPQPRAAFVLDGGELKVAEGGDGSLDAYLKGVTSFHLGAGGGAIDTCGRDVTVVQTLSPTGLATTAGFTKRGAGTLTLGGDDNLNWMYGPLVVEAGTLKAGFETCEHRPIPEGAEVLWTFDGADPYADKTGHGNRLEDLTDATYNEPVAVTNEDAFVGNAIKFRTNKAGALKSDRMQLGTGFKDSMTVSVRFRLVSLNRDRNHSSFFSTRCARDMTTAADSSFDIGFKSLTTLQVDETTEGLGTVWHSGKASVSWRMIGTAFGAESPAGWRFEIGRWYNVCLVNDNGLQRTYLDGVLVRENESASVNFLANKSYMMTVGLGHKGGERMQTGGMLDEIAVFSRALGDGEVKALYSAEAAEAVFPVTVAKDAVWDMNASTATVTSVSGAGTVANGRLIVREKLACSPADGTLALADVAFGANGTINLGYGDAPRPRGETTLVTFGSVDGESLANLREWTVTGEGTDSRTSVSVKITERGVTAQVTPRGLMLLVR